MGSAALYKNALVDARGAFHSYCNLMDMVMLVIYFMNNCGRLRALGGRDIRIAGVSMPSGAQHFN